MGKHVSKQLLEAQGIILISREFTEVLMFLENFNKQKLWIM